MNADIVLQKSMEFLIELSRMTHERADQSKKEIHLLLAGYNGSRNTGGDVRVEEMIRQFKNIFGESLQMDILSINPKLTKGYFKGVHQIKLKQVFPGFLYNLVKNYDGVVACEGSMFKSKFANALTIMMAGSLGLANAQRKLSVGYGAEVGHMTDHLEKFVRKYCQKSYVICRNVQSQKMLSDFNIRNESGADTAWTFCPSPDEVARSHLMNAGWDGKKPVLTICPINPFWWPVKPSLSKTFMHMIAPSWYQDTHYQSIYFHEYDEQAKKQYNEYIASIAKAVNAFADKHDYFLSLVAMESLDQGSCRDLSKALNSPFAVFLSQDINMYDLVSILRQSTLMISSRFHAVVTSMPKGVVSMGITMDERLKNIMHERKHSELLLYVDEPKLDEKLLHVLSNMHSKKASYQNEVLSTVPSQIKLMSHMGKCFYDEVRNFYPNLKLGKTPSTFEDFLPPLSKDIQTLMEKYT